AAIRNVTTITQTLEPRSASGSGSVSAAVVGAGAGFGRGRGLGVVPTELRAGALRTAALRAGDGVFDDAAAAGAPGVRIRREDGVLTLPTGVMPRLTSVPSFAWAAGLSCGISVFGGGAIGMLVQGSSASMISEACWYRSAGFFAIILSMIAIN